MSNAVRVDTNCCNRASIAPFIHTQAFKSLFGNAAVAAVRAAAVAAVRAAAVTLVIGASQQPFISPTQEPHALHIQKLCMQ
jgi:hypothetical protein